jgi:hypothetical protein
LGASQIGIRRHFSANRHYKSWSSALLFRECCVTILEINVSGPNISVTVLEMTVARPCLFGGFATTSSKSRFCEIENKRYTVRRDQGGAAILPFPSVFFRFDKTSTLRCPGAKAAQDERRRAAQSQSTIRPNICRLCRVDSILGNCGFADRFFPETNERFAIFRNSCNGRPRMCNAYLGFRDWHQAQKKAPHISVTFPKITATFLGV